MVFSSFIFLFYFLPLCLICYYVTPKKFKNLILTLFSLLFYAWGAPKIFPLFMLSCIIDFGISSAISKSENQKTKKLLLYSSIFLNISALLYYKYSNFFISNINDIFFSALADKISWTKVILPIGISFFTFHKISYSVDVYRKTVAAEKSFIDYCLYITLFPQLIAGPIIRYHDIFTEISNREHTVDKCFDGFIRFSIGLAKKVLIADSMGSVADTIFSLPAEKLSTSWAWIGILTYAMQIYYDFSGYSDMAIGLGKLFGFTFLENFDQPYISKNITEFWRRWHISLSRWMRDYLYIPLGGNRLGTKRTYLNLWIVFLLSGLWHGASWNFILWGAFHGLFLCLDKLFLIKALEYFPNILQTVLTFMLVLIGWVLFRTENLTIASNFLTVMFYNTKENIITPYGLVYQNYDVFIFILAFVLTFFPIHYKNQVMQVLNRNTSIKVSLIGFTALVLYLLSILKLSGANYSPFIYFQF